MQSQHLNKQTRNPKYKQIRNTIKTNLLIFMMQFLPVASSVIPEMGRSPNMCSCPSLFSSATVWLPHDAEMIPESFTFSIFLYGIGLGLLAAATTLRLINRVSFRVLIKAG